jgi:hemerythrin-like domain-containing protein
VVDAALSYVQSNFDHMRLEENTVFPGAEDTLTEDDWAAIKVRLSASADPLFGSIQEQRYTGLYEAILEESD